MFTVKNTGLRETCGKGYSNGSTGHKINKN
jgi:hypothetical protein